MKGKKKPLTQKQAWDLVNAEIRAERMVRPGQCMTCDVKNKLWGHHWRGYQHPLDVWWVCSACNRILDIHDGSQTLEEVREQVKAARASGGDAHRSRQAAASRAASERVREAGQEPPVQDQARKDRGRASLVAFGTEYFPRRFRLQIADCHRVACAKIEECTDDGGQTAVAMPRGTGKTAWAEVAVIRAILYGLRRYAVLVCATNSLSKKRLKSIIKELESNPLLLADFPEVCHFIGALKRIHQRAHGQTRLGVATRIEITAEAIVLPTVTGSPASGAIIQVLSMEGAIRGLNVAGPDGEQLRPDLILLDDVQTRESAKSPILTEDREILVTDDVMGLAGPDVTIAAIMLCTVMYTGDLSSRFLDRERHPEWDSVRTKMIEKFPDRMDLWDEYAEIRRESQRSGDKGRRGNSFYAANREAMDAGAVVSWPERMKKSDLSGLQSAMNMYYENPRGFRAECQNEPEPEGGVAGAKELFPAEVVVRLSGCLRCEVPREASRVVAFIDPGGGQGRGIWYAVAALDNTFGGSLIDYGCWPRQSRAMFSATDLQPDITQRYPGHALSEAVYAGLVDLSAEILGRVYIRETTGEQLKVERCLVDCGWEPPTVHQFCRASSFPLYPSKGIGRTATSRGVSEWKPRPGEKSGWHWRLTVSETGRGRMVQFDPDAWKSFLFERLTTRAGGRGYFSLFGKATSEHERSRAMAVHELLGLHLAAERAEPATLRGNTFDKWEVKIGSPDNHLFDCLVGCMVAAATEGLVWSSSTGGATPAAPKTKLADLVAAKRAGKLEKPTTTAGPVAVAEPVTGAKVKRNLADIQAEKRALRRKW